MEFPFEGNNFLFLIGAPKCGTTSLADWLGRHSKITIAKKKEPGFFRSEPKRWVLDAHKPDQYTEPSANSPMKASEAYAALFRDAADGDWMLDASTDYLSDPGAAEAIRGLSEQNNVRLIIVLRDPIDRAFSEYKHTLRDDLEPLSFRESLDAEPERRLKNYQPLFFHLERSRFFTHVDLYRSLFNSDLLYLSISELQNTEDLMRKLAKFLRIDAEDLGEMEKLNISKKRRIGRKKKIGGMFRDLRDLVNPKKDERSIAGTASLNESDRQFVYSNLRDEIEKCINDPEIPTDDWASSNSLYSRNH